MDPKKLLLAVLLAVLLMVCSKNGTGPDNNGPSYILPSALVGTWLLDRTDGDIHLTTKTAQTAYDFPSPATGSIQVTGTHTASLTYFVPKVADVIRVAAASASFLEMEDTLIYPAYTFMVISTNTAVYAALHAYIDSATTDTFLVIGPSYDFDSTNYVLTLNNLTLNTATGGKSVTLNGTLSARTVDLPALTQTFVSHVEDIDDDDEVQTMTLDDSTFTRVIERATTVDTTTGTWELVKDTFTIIDHEFVGPDTFKDTAHYTIRTYGAGYSFTDTELQDFNDGTGDLYTTLEWVFGLDSTSVDTAVVRIEYNFLPQ